MASPTATRGGASREGRFGMANRGFLLLAAIGTAVGLAACGRATDEQISTILGVTPTPTRTA